MSRDTQASKPTKASRVEWLLKQGLDPTEVAAIVGTPLAYVHTVNNRRNLQRQSRARHYIHATREAT